MQISRTGTCKSFANCNFSKHGFTLIELVVVIFLISIITALVMPSLWSTDRGSLKNSANHLSSTLRYMYDEALSKKQSYFFNINFTDRAWGFKSENESKSFKTENDFDIKDVIVPSLGKVHDGELLLEFGPLGPAEPVTLHLQKGNAEYTIIFNHLNGRTKILEGYHQ
ncbi:MAG: prepilin-type N-terminal cleavage/methylation domain-containing protein [Nitrospirae bacterium]|nr:prepilin-type N-terminal cleavage/methylation domain-containing protein [Nitrospirota bacterium]